MFLLQRRKSSDGGISQCFRPLPLLSKRITKRATRRSSIAGGQVMLSLVNLFRLRASACPTPSVHDPETQLFFTCIAIGDYYGAPFENRVQARTGQRRREESPRYRDGNHRGHRNTWRCRFARDLGEI